jgi:hypothetical protein
VPNPCITAHSQRGSHSDWPITCENFGTPHSAQLKERAVVGGVNVPLDQGSALHVSEWRYSDRWASYTVESSGPRKRSMPKADVTANQRDELNLLELYSGRCTGTVSLLGVVVEPSSPSTSEIGHKQFLA